ncbi:siderophore-interacting protein [Ornithinimicrobium ciconiae]|uniref:Siderophore-interacting protein n=1 Tax=Ornithinimicrobium ciconiae TaxID=2594265 RepID=A0A516G618_9MICO|nr:siderophore-interacting protein [Ornithinimicrobium ciconiae]QDO86968.1 siderophore-interacting protein [Ornithinimicrobium ciconiae]
MSRALRVRDTLIRAAYARSMSMPIEREAHQLFRVTVTAAEQVSPIMRRLTLRAPELADYQPLGPDEYFGLVMPAAGQDLPALPEADPDRATPRGSFDVPDEQQPDVRWYTIRAHRPEVGEVDVDVVTHGDAGPGSAWVLRAEVGSQAAFQTGTAAYRTEQASGAQVIAGDETALPAISRILEELPATVEAHVFLEVPAVTDVPPLPSPRSAMITVVERGTGLPGSALVPAIEAASLPIPTASWIAGEKATVAAVRRYLTSEIGAAKRAVYFCPYWILGKPRG